jgi:hypothetical protein
LSQQKPWYLRLQRHSIRSHIPTEQQLLNLSTIPSPCNHSSRIHSFPRASCMHIIYHARASRQDEVTAPPSLVSPPSLLARLRASCDAHTEAELLSMARRSLPAPNGGASRASRAGGSSPLPPSSPTPAPRGSRSPPRSSAGPPPSPMRRKALTLTRLGRFPQLVPAAAVASPPTQLGSPRRRSYRHPALRKHVAPLLSMRSLVDAPGLTPPPPDLCSL